MMQSYGNVVGFTIRLHFIVTFFSFLVSALCSLGVARPNRIEPIRFVRPGVKALRNDGLRGTVTFRAPERLIPVSANNPRTKNGFIHHKNKRVGIFLSEGREDPAWA